MIGDELKAAEARLRNLGWRTASSGALVTKKEKQDDKRFRSAGTMVVSAARIGQELVLPFTSFDLSPKDHPGRISAAWLRVMGGIVCCSSYSYCGEEWSTRNWALWKRLGTCKRQTQAPWIVALDANMSPTVFLQGAAQEPHEGLPWAIVAAEQSCKVKDKWTNIDWFLVDVRLLPFVEGAFAIPWPSWPHCPIVLKLRTEVKFAHRLVQHAPRTLPKQRPIGCIAPVWPGMTTWQDVGKRGAP